MLQINTPQVLSINHQESPHEPAVRIRAMFNESKGVYVNVSVTVEHPAVAVTPTKIAKMRLGTVKRDGLRAQLEEHNPELTEIPAVRSFFRNANGRKVAGKVRLEPSIEHLEIAALIYKLARIVGDFPVLAIARCFSIEHVDARRWVASAKKEGLL